MKVAVIGGGSSYTLAHHRILKRIDTFPELWLMDILPERLTLSATSHDALSMPTDHRFKVHLTTNQQEAVRDASYVTTQLRVGWMQARRR